MASHIKMRETCTLVGDKPVVGQHANGKVIPWGRTLEVGSDGPDGISEKHAAALLQSGYAVALARVIFDVPAGPYNTGDVAAFPEKEADLLVKSRKARPFPLAAS